MGDEVVGGIAVVGMGSFRGRPRLYLSHIGLDFGILAMVGENVGESGERVGVVVVGIL